MTNEVTLAFFNARMKGYAMLPHLKLLSSCLLLSMTLSAERIPESAQASLSQEDQELIADLFASKAQGDIKKREQEPQEVKRVVDKFVHLFEPHERCFAFVGSIDKNSGTSTLNLGNHHVSLNENQKYYILKELLFEHEANLEQRNEDVSIFDFLILKHEFQLLNRILSDVRQSKKRVSLDTLFTAKSLLTREEQRNDEPKEEIAAAHSLLDGLADFHKKELMKPLKQKDGDWSRYSFFLKTVDYF